MQEQIKLTQPNRSTFDESGSAQTGGASGPIIQRECVNSSRVLPPAAADDGKSGQKCSKVDRASYFAANILRCVLQEGRGIDVYDYVRHSLWTDVSKPQYVRVNSLKLDIESAIQELGKVNKVTKDDMVPDLLVLSSGTDLHDHPLVINGSVFLRVLFPSVERVVYSTCSIHQIENEDVVKSVLPLATSLSFQLVAPFPQWERRGHPVFEGAKKLLRTDLVEDMEVFFIALFVRKTIADYIEKPIF